MKVGYQVIWVKWLQVSPWLCRATGWGSGRREQPASCPTIRGELSSPDSVIKSSSSSQHISSSWFVKNLSLAMKFENVNKICEFRWECSSDQMYGIINVIRFLWERPTLGTIFRGWGLQKIWNFSKLHHQIRKSGSKNFYFINGNEGIDNNTLWLSQCFD